MSMLGERLEPLLPQLAATATRRRGHNGEGSDRGAGHEPAVQTRAEPRGCRAAERLLTDYAPVLGPTDLHRYALQVVDAADPDGPEPVDDQLQQDRRYVELNQRRDGMWHLQGKLTNTVGAQLNAILDPLARPRTPASKTSTATHPNTGCPAIRATAA